MSHTPGPHCDFADGADLASEGFDSLSAVELASSISKAVGVQLPSTIFYDYPSLSSMSQFIHAQLVPPEVQSRATPLGVASQLIAVSAETMTRGPVSMAVAGRLPATDCRLEIAASDSIGLVPFGRWDLDLEVNAQSHALEMLVSLAAIVVCLHTQKLLMAAGFIRA